MESVLWKVLTFAFAIHEINKREDLLPNITLGFDIYDSGINDLMTIERTFRILSGNHKLIPNYSCRKQEKVFALIGHFVPSCSHAMADLLSLYKYPQISYGAKTDKDQYLHSTIPSGHLQNEAILALLQYFEWKMVGIVTIQEENFKRLSQEIKTEIIKIGYCVELYIVFEETDNIPEKYHANVIIIYCYLREAEIVASLFSRSSAKVLIMINEGENFLPKTFTFDPLNCSLWFFKNKKNVQGFHRFNQTASNGLSENTFLDVILEECHNNDKDDNLLKYLSKNETMELKNNVYTAVYVAAHALHSLLYRPHITMNRNELIKQYNLISWQLIYHLKNVSFTIPGGDKIYFDERGHVTGDFDILNSLVIPYQTLVYSKVGTFDPSAPQGEKFKINDSKIQWLPHFTQVPKSVCSESCSPGYRKVHREGQQICCYDCVLCPEGEITNVYDMDNCIKCKEHQWTDKRRDKCIQRETEYLSFHDFLGIFLMTTSLFFCAITTGIYSIFYKHRTTCIVRANNLHLSYILLFSLMLSFLSSLLFIGRPNEVTCLVRQVIFGIIFASELSTLIGKTMTVVIAFSATQPGSKLAKWMKTQITYSIVLLLSFGQVVICSVWLICSPPFPHIDTKSKTGMIILLCNEGSVVAFYIMVGYIGILAIVSFLLAYYARRLPDRFNESQLITFSMLVFCCVWISFIPAYINTKGRSVVAVEVFAILTSNAGLLGFIFIPKCYIIILRPGLNNKQHLIRNK
ncbi:hypothetical protein XELAEV_18040175mg [Xenopus laevis]|uniref:G-protein coupled receptors family 3 profile domain-containing protein n=1 Tax=Xenopus laevis TaxID=8355 RepID=A0A974H8N2_XENLA|nr:hypothetical protein XELAEV_18040175mg [Xenopus laevis]